MTGGVDLAARLVVGLEGAEPTAREWAWLQRWRPAGVILFARNVSGPRQAAGLCKRLHDLLPGLEIMADHEGGPVSPLAAAVGRPPAAWGLGRLGDTDLTERVHTATAVGLAALGVDRVLAPVADVLTGRRNPVIGVRAFGADNGLVAEHVAAAVTGLQRGGIKVCLKHWPGHGGSAVDSHLAASPLVEEPPLAPFLAGLAAGADAVMLGHLQGAEGMPATLDPAEIRGLRERMPAPGSVFCDDVTMGALREAMNRQGVDVPGGEGLVEPGDLGADWFAALAAAGHDRLFVRGIPWRAFPDPENSEPTVSGPDGTDEHGPSPDPAWTETWDRLRERLPADFTADRPDVLWLDRTAGDRWGPADGTGACLVPDPAAMFGEVLGGPQAAAGAVSRLLVTSHRPLDRDDEAAAGWTGCLAPTGIALGVGHPALADALAALLPAGWRVVHLPEWRL